MEGNTNKNNNLVWIIVVFLVALCGYFAYELYAKPVEVGKDNNKQQTEEKKKENEKEEVENKEEVLNVNDPLITKLSLLISASDINMPGVINEQLKDKETIMASEFSNVAKLYLGYLRVADSQKNKLNLNNYDRSKVNFTYNNQDFSKWVYDDVTPISTINGNTMKLLVEEIFGSNSYISESFCPGYNKLSTIYFYNATNDEYVEYPTEGGGTGGWQLTNISNAVKTNDTVTMQANYKVLTDNTVSYYEFTFKLQNDNYYFYSVKKLA